MKKITRKAKNIIKKIFVVVMALLAILLLAAAIITLSKLLFKLFVICLAIYFSFIFYETVIWPWLRRR